MPYEDHGDPRNVIEKHFENAGETKEIDKKGLLKAKENMIDLLMLEEDKGELEKPKENYSEPD